MSAVAQAEELDVEREAILDPAIRFDAPMSAYSLAPRNIFLTGATGFTGVYLLDELLRKTTAKIQCLVRAADRSAARERILKQLASYGLWRQEYAARIEAVPGDLSKPGLGLSAAEFLDLGGKIDTIYHIAGWVNMAYPYPRLKPANVEGTKEILRLAGLRTTKPVHFLSSIAVFYTDIYANGEINETDIPEYHASLKGGYSVSKWVADRLVAQAQERGLPACLYRPVRIMGHSQTGAINEVSDLLPLLLKGCLLLGKYPAFDIKITLVPVDYVTRAMVHLAGREESWGRAFHFFNPEPVEWRRLMKALRNTGYALEEVAYDEWWRDLKQQVRNTGLPQDERETLSTLMLAMTAPHYLFYQRPVMDASQTEEGLRGSGIACPPVDDALIATYAAWWQKSGFFPAFR